jgi:hypothetical protein
LDADTASKVVVTDGLGSEALGGVVPLELIPKELGGTSDAPFPRPLDAGEA